MANIEELKKYKNIHMIGIGGISMSGIAEILKFWGYKNFKPSLFPLKQKKKAANVFNRFFILIFLS